MQIFYLVQLIFVFDFLNRIYYQLLIQVLGLVQLLVIIQLVQILTMLPVLRVLDNLKKHIHQHKQTFYSLSKSQMAVCPFR